MSGNHTKSGKPKSGKILNIKNSLFAGKVMEEFLVTTMTYLEEWADIKMHKKETLQYLWCEKKETGRSACENTTFYFGR